MASRRPNTAWMGAMVLIGPLLIGGVGVAIPAHAGADEFLNDLNNIGIGNLNDPHNFDLVGFGNAICWRLYDGEAPAQITERAFNESRTGSQVLTHEQAGAAVRFAKADLCPDATTG